MICDYHVHSYYSDDSEYPMEDIILDAIYKGIDQLCFTDHVDYGIKTDPMGKDESELKGKVLNVNYPAYFAEIAELRKKYEGRISIKQGMEFGVQTHTIPQYEKLFSEYPFDFIILSCHQVEDQEFWTQDFQSGRTRQEYNERYYEEILRVIKAYRNYSVLGHLDLIARYDRYGAYPFENVSEIIGEILRQAIADGKGIELNTSSFRYGLADWTPSTDILKLYRDLGGTVLTIGSDSHEPEHLGAHIGKAMEMLKDLGFRYYCTYDGMEPIFRRL